MKRLAIAALALVAVGVVTGSALAATRSSVIYDSTNPNGPPTNQVSFGPAAYNFNSIGDQITFQPGTARSLTNATVTLSSFACQQGTWTDQSCATQPGATFPQDMTLKIYDANGYDAATSNPIATSTQTFAVPYRPSASPKCLTILDPIDHHVVRPGGWYQQSTKTCKNGLTDDVTFNFSGVKLPPTVVYAISYPTGSEPSNSLNVAVTDQLPSVGSSTDSKIWIDGASNDSYGDYTPSVQFKAGNAS